VSVLVGRKTAVIVASSEKHLFQTFQWFQRFHRFALFIMGIGPFQTFQTFHRFAPFKGCACSRFKVQWFKDRVGSEGSFHVSRILETSK
jgi:hypothetical protein